jgi:TonB family protein
VGYLPPLLVASEVIKRKAVERIANPGEHSMKSSWLFVAVLVGAGSAPGCAGGGADVAQATPQAVSLAGFADSAAIVHELEQAGESAEGVLIARPFAFSASEPLSLEVLHSTLSQDVTERLRDVIQRHLYKDGGDRPSGVIHARVHPGRVAIRAVRTTGHPAELLNSPLLAERLKALANEYQRDASASVAILVGRDGRPVRSEIRLSSGNRVLDRDLVELVRLARFKPGEVAGYPASLWMELPLDIRAPR